MTFTFRPARREDVSLLIGVAGGTGAGKTMSAMRLARGLAGDKPFAVIDTESGRAQHYGDRFQPWEHGDLTAPFRPARYAEAIEAADKAGYPVILVDSFSHEHAGDGGLLDWHEEEFQRLGGRDSVKMSAWIKPKAEHRKMVTRLLQVRAHLILCFRAEPKVEMVKVGGKTEVRPKSTLTGLDGWVPISEKNLPFELTASFLLLADQPGVPRPIKLPDELKPFIPLSQPLDEETGVRLGEWARGAAAEGEGGKPSAASSTASPSATALELIAVADQLGAGESVRFAIEKNRAQHDGGPEHEAWLERQLRTAKQRLADEKSPPGEEAGATPLPPASDESPYARAAREATSS